jgi:hypothetical protein
MKNDPNFSGSFLLSANVVFGALQNAYRVHQISMCKLFGLFPIVAVFV